jgi:hypothetical protein
MSHKFYLKMAPFNVLFTSNPQIYSESIFTRTYFQLDDLYPEEKDYPLAFTRIVFKVR